MVHARRVPDVPFDVPYDSLIVAAGAGQSYFGHDEFAIFAPGMKTIDDALELKRRIFGAFEMAEVAPTLAEKQEWLTIVVVGAGPTGVEIAGQIRELASRSLRGEFRTFDPADVRVLLVDGGTEPLATFGHRLSEAAARQLRSVGVELMMGARVVNIDASGVDIKGSDGTQHIAAHAVVWAAGVQASPLAAQLAAATGAEVDRAGHITPLPDLTLPGHPEVFVVGDMVTLDKLPGVAEVAMQGSLHAANTIRPSSPGRRTHAPLPLPRPRERRHHRPLPGGRELLAVPVERPPRVVRLDLRAPRVPERVRDALHDGVPLVHVDGRPHPHRTGLQRRAHRWRSERARRRARGLGHDRVSRAATRSGREVRSADSAIRSRRVVACRRARHPFLEAHPGSCPTTIVATTVTR